MRWYKEPVILLALLVGWSRSRGPCDPLVPEYCQLPSPNSFFTRPDTGTPTGIRVNFSADTFPKDAFGRGIDPAEWNAMDGFTPFPSIMTFFPDLSDSNLPPHWNIQLSLDPSSPTVLMNFDTGEILAHYAELDTALGLPQRALMLWPSQRLLTSHHYIVALRSLVDQSGNLIQPSEAFIALRDNISTTNPDIEYRRGLYEQIFAKLEGAGIQRKSLQLAWDFTTASLDCITKRLLFMRDDAFKRVGPDGPSYQIDEVNDNYSDHIFRRLKGTMTVPCYLSSFLPGSHLVIDSSGLPVYQNDAVAEFTVLVPHSVANGSIFPAMALQYGHGLFGDQSEVETSYLQAQADKYGYVMIACNWWGMDQDDVPSIVLMVATNLSDFRIIPDRLHQGMVNALALMRMMKGSLSKDPLLTFGGRQVVDTSQLHYYGNSLGGILGDVYMASTTDVIRGVLGVPGGPFPLLLPRSVDFESFEFGLRILYPDPVDYVSGIGLVGMLWSRLEPNGYMSYITKNPLPNTPTHRVLYHYALGDAQVNILGLYAIARSAGAIMFNNNVHCQFSLPGGQVVTEKIFGFPIVPVNTTVTQDVVAVGFDCGAPPEPSGNTPPDKKTDTHEGPRRSPLAHEQIDLFLRSGVIKNVCNGVCKCTV